MLAPRILFLALSLFAPLAPAAAFQAGATLATPPAVKGAALLERVVVIGASLSAGYGLGKDGKGADLDLARVIEAGLLARHGAILDASSELTFLDAPGAATAVAGKLAKADPTLVVALDYVFWFGYGARWGGEKERLDALELGLKPLADLRCPILLGDFADMRSAVTSKAPVLPAKAVPEPETLVKLNARLSAWAKEHPNVILVPVSKMMLALNAHEEVRVGPNLWRADAVGGLLQVDGLHPTLEGTTGIWLCATERLFEARKDLPRAALESKAGPILAKLAPELKLLVSSEPAKEKKPGKSAPAKSVH
jgi:hypothetical protein